MTTFPRSTHPLRFSIAALLSAGLMLTGCGTEADRDTPVVANTPTVSNNNPAAIPVSDEAREEHAKSGYAFGPISVTRSDRSGGGHWQSGLRLHPDRRE